jgi:hypothetical protein
MGMRAGFKGIASSVTGGKVESSKTKKIVDLFWYLVYAVVGVLFIMMMYKRCSR